jgi:hypothetical protein
MEIFYTIYSWAAAAFITWFIVVRIMKMVNNDKSKYDLFDIEIHCSSKREYDVINAMFHELLESGDKINKDGYFVSCVSIGTYQDPIIITACKEL